MLNTAPLGAQHGRPARALRGGLCSNWASTSYCCLGTCSGSIEILERGHTVEAVGGASAPTQRVSSRVTSLLGRANGGALFGAAKPPGCLEARDEGFPVPRVHRPPRSRHPRYALHRPGE